MLVMGSESRNGAVVLETVSGTCVSTNRYNPCSSSATEVCPVLSVSGIEVPFWRIKASSAFFVWLSAVFR